jgi:hypothetical protein
LIAHTIPPTKYYSRDIFYDTISSIINHQSKIKQKPKQAQPAPAPVTNRTHHTNLLGFISYANPHLHLYQLQPSLTLPRQRVR